LYHLGEGTRAYDGNLMLRFLQYDKESPFGGGGINPYAYCGGDPVTFTDPSGRELASNEDILSGKTLEPFWEVLAGIAAFASGVGMAWLGPWLAASSIVTRMVSILPKFVSGKVMGYLAGAKSVGMSVKWGTKIAGGTISLAQSSVSAAAQVAENREMASTLRFASNILGLVGDANGYFSILNCRTLRDVRDVFIDRGTSPGTAFSRAAVVADAAYDILFKGYSISDVIYSSRESDPAMDRAFTRDRGGVLVQGVRGSPLLPQTPDGSDETVSQLMKQYFGDCGGPTFNFDCGGTEIGVSGNAQAIAEFQRRVQMASSGD
jgi:hypothetical protein